MSRTLEQLQADFQDYVLGNAPAQPAIMADIAAQYGLNAEMRLAIYYDAYRLRLCEALSEAFVKTHTYLGDELFAALSADYIQDNPSPYRNLRWYGDGFASHLARALPDHPAVAELASFEWALGLAFDATDAPTLDAEGIRSLDAEAWEHIGFRLQPSVQFLSLRSNAATIWLALDREEAPPAALTSEEAVSWLIWRKELRPHFRSLTRYESDALQGLREGVRFSAVCEAAAEKAGEQNITLHIAGWLQTWLGEAVLANVHRPEPAI